MSGTWWSVAAVVVCLLLAAVVGLDRNRVRRQLGRTEGTLAGLRLDLAATQDRVVELQRYLSQAENWSSDAVPPRGLVDPTLPDRHSPPVPARATSPDSTTSRLAGRQPTE